MRTHLILLPVAQNNGGKLVLVHGYCAGQNEFPLSQFENAVHFEDFEQSRTTDEFALKLRQFGDQFPAFSIVRHCWSLTMSNKLTRSIGTQPVQVGHSQGGLAATHLHAYYWSNLENAKGGRLIQSVGSPYYGSGIAGNLAAIGMHSFSPLLWQNQVAVLESIFTSFFQVLSLVWAVARTMTSR